MSKKLQAVKLHINHTTRTKRKCLSSCTYALDADTEADIDREARVEHIKSGSGSKKGSEREREREREICVRIRILIRISISISTGSCESCMGVEPIMHIVVGI